jgi:hypothetical protein
MREGDSKSMQEGAGKVVQEGAGKVVREGAGNVKRLRTSGRNAGIFAGMWASSPQSPESISNSVPGLVS